MWTPPSLCTDHTIGVSSPGCQRARLLLVLAATAALPPACQSIPDAEYQPQAEVTIEGHSLKEIEVRTELVFRKNGWQFAEPAGRELVFEKPASRMTNLAYGGWFDKTWMRARVRIRPLESGVIKVQCEVRRVEGIGLKSFEETKRIRKSSGRPYQELLDEVKASFVLPKGG